MKKDKNKPLKKRITWLQKIIPAAGIILIVSGFIAYSNTFDASFQWDDLPQILDKDVVHDPANFLSFDAWRNVNLRPFSQWTFSLNYVAGGDHVAGYHLVNLLLHILTAFLIFLFSRFTIGLLTGEESLDQRLKDVSALFIALLFLLHPLQTMAVTYIVQRMTILAALFYVLAVFFYAKGRILYLGNKEKKGIGLLVLAIFAGILGVLSKQNAVTFPVAFLLYELFFVRKANGQMCRKYIITGGSAIVLTFLIILVSGVLPVETSNITRIEYLSAQFGIFHKYILLILFPVSQNVDYFIRVEPPLFGAAQYLGIFIILAMAGGASYLFKRNRLIAFGIFWFLMTMSVESSLIPIRDIMMEHRMYLPLLGIGMVAAGLIMQFVAFNSRLGLYIAGIVIFIILGTASFNRNKIWKTKLTLWEDCLERNPENPRAMNNLGLVIKINADAAPTLQARQRDLRTAITYFSNAMKCDTIFVQAYLNRGLTWFELKEYNKALSDINTVVEHQPKEEYLSYYVQGVALAKQGEIEAAANMLNKAALMKNDFALIHTWRGLVYAELKNYQMALDSYLMSLKLNPDQAILYVNVSNMYYYLREYQDALMWITKAQDAGEQVDYEYIHILEEQVTGR